MEARTISNANFLSVRGYILRRRARVSALSLRKGVAREVKAKWVLEMMKCAGDIVAFVPTGGLSLADLQGIDFYVVVLRHGRREVRKLAVTGPRWVQRKRELHPDVEVIGIEVEEDDEEIREKFLRALD